VANEIVELNRIYEDGFLRVRGNYSRFLETKEDTSAQGKRQDALRTRVTRKSNGFRRGPKARSTKAKARIGKAHEMIGELAELNTRTRSSTARIDFSASNRQTKQLVRLRKLTYVIGGRTLFKDVDFTH